MKEEPIQKEFGEIEHEGNIIRIRGFGTKDRRVLGEAILSPVNDSSVKHYRLHDFKVSKDERGKGFGSQILDEVEAISKSTNTPVVLSDSVNRHINPNVAGLYGRRGWVLVQN